MPLSEVQLISNASIVLLSQDQASELGPGTTLVYSDGAWRNNGVPYTLLSTT